MKAHDEAFTNHDLKGVMAYLTEKAVIMGTGPGETATVGAMIVRDWGVSAEALLLTGGIILFLVALRLVLQQYAPPEAPSEGQESTTAPMAPSSLAFAPLAFPTIVTPYGIAVLVVLVSASNAMVTEILALRRIGRASLGSANDTAVVLVLDLLAMLFADRILKTAFVASSLNIAGVMGVLQVALGVEVLCSLCASWVSLTLGAQLKPSRRRTNAR